MACVSQVFGLVGAVGRDQDILKFVDGVAGGNGLLLEDIEACSSDFLLGERAHQGCLVDDRTAADVDDDR